MSRKLFLTLAVLLALIPAAAACAPAPAEPETVTMVETVVVEMEGETIVETVEVMVEVEVESERELLNPTSGPEVLTIAARTNRKIIKNAEVRILVKDTDLAIDGVTQIVGDVGGYIISSRVWYDTWGEESYKYGTFTLGVPVDEFERTLRRLRDISIQVLDEKATGQDVTDQFVDLQSQLENLEATQERIRGFLDQAETDEEALAVNEELSAIEAQIEEIKGRMNYLADRAAFSTITITIEPELEELPTPTPEPTTTLVPTSTPRAWRPSETLNQATDTLKNTYQRLIDILIWIVFVILPVLLPFFFIAWLLWRFVFRKLFSKTPQTKGNGDE